MGRGETRRTMEWFGCPTERPRAGRHITSDIGSGLIPWGWTWVDDAPWGFAPFHYGRWAYVGGSWGWIPGPVSQRPVYAPALVAWVGGDAVGGGVGWFALGPHEVYVPSYHTSPTYFTRVNVSNTVIVNNVNITNVNITTVNYVNRCAPGAVMAVQREAFASCETGAERRGHSAPGSDAIGACSGHGCSGAHARKRGAGARRQGLTW